MFLIAFAIILAETKKARQWRAGNFLTIKFYVMTNLNQISQLSKTSSSIYDAGNLALQRIFETDHDFSNPIIKEVTPEKAKKLLALNKKNRNLNKRHVDWLSIQMELGYWIFCGQVVGVDKSGNLINLQHTLNALISSGTTQKFICISGIDDRAIDVMDTGKARTAADVLQMNGIKNAVNLAAVIKRVINFESKSYASVVSTGNRGVGGLAKGVRGDNSFVTNKAILERIRLDHDYWQEIHKTTSTFYNSFRGLTHTDYGVLYHYALSIDEYSAWEFFAKFSSGIGLKKDSPMYQLRRALEKDLMSKTVKHPGRQKLFWAITSWNAFRNKESMVRMFPYSPKDDMPEMI